MDISLAQGTRVFIALKVGRSLSAKLLGFYVYIKTWGGQAAPEWPRRPRSREKMPNPVLIQQPASGSVRGQDSAQCYCQARAAHTGRAPGRGHVPKMDILEITYMHTHIYSLTLSVVVTPATVKTLSFLRDEIPRIHPDTAVPCSGHLGGAWV